MPPNSLSPEQLTRALAGLQVVSVSADAMNQLTMHFSSGIALTVNINSDKLVAALMRPDKRDTRPQPTKRQSEYLAFILKYMTRYGRSPAESDIQRHFLVSAPTVNQMMQNLERCGYITRQKGIPRSIRVCISVQGNP